MQLNTKHFGKIDVDETKVIEFKNSLLGFPDSKRFLLMTDQVSGTENIFYWLQSVDEPEIAFVMVDVINMFPDYDPLVNKELVEDELGIYDAENFFVYNIANIQESVADLTVNLQAPIIINDKRKMGYQAICENEDYSIRHYLFK